MLETVMSEPARRVWPLMTRMLGWVGVTINRAASTVGVEPISASGSTCSVPSIMIPGPLSGRE